LSPAGAAIGAWLDCNLPEAAYASVSVAVLVNAVLGLEIAGRACRVPVSVTVREEPPR